MKQANDNVEYEHKAEYIRLQSIVFPEIKSTRWDKNPSDLGSMLWFLRFENSMKEELIQEKREKIREVR